MTGGQVENVALQLDALGEIANIICGQIFPHLDPDHAFQQEPPNVIVSGHAHEGLPVAVAQVDMGLDRSRAEILLYVFGDTTPEAA
jgi:hypothetical protein